MSSPADGRCCTSLPLSVTSLTVVLQTFSDIHHLNPRRLLELAAVDDELVGHHAGRAREQDLVVALQPLLHVVGVQDGYLSGLLQTLVAHHLQEKSESMTMLEDIDYQRRAITFCSEYDYH